MRQSRPWAALATLLLTIPVVAYADLNQAVILQSNTTLSMDTGTVAASGGDLLWNGSTLAPQGTAKARNLGKIGSVNYGFTSQASATSDASGGTATPIAAALIVPGDALAVLTNGGKVAKALITANAGGVLTLQFTTYGVTGAAGVPVVSQIVNNSSFTPPGSANYGIAPSSLFVINGSSLADAGAPVLQSSAAPGLPLSLNGADIAVVVNGVTTHPAIYYTTPTAIAAVLPAATPVGSGALTVTYRGKTSAPSPILVVPAALGFNVYNTNTAVATDNSTGALLSYANSGAPGETIVLWTTGLGANQADSDTTLTASPHAVNTPLQIYIGGVAATILYQGASAYPGVNQIDVTIPQTVPSGCWVPMAAVAGGVVSNIVTLPVRAGGGACLDPFTGLSGSELSPSGGQTLRTGLVSLVRTNSPVSGARSITTSANAAFVKYTGLYTPATSLSPGGCIVTQTLTAVPVPAVTGLDVGSITFTGPAGAPVTMTPVGIKGVFNSQLGAAAIPPTGGSFTFKGTGGADVGAFTSTISLANPLLTWTNETSLTSIDRSQGLPFTWTGGNPGTYVYITGTSTSTGLGYGGFTCLIPVDAGQFTVPSYVLSSLPAGTGGIAIQNAFQNPLTASGIDIGAAAVTVSYSSGALTFK